MKNIEKEIRVLVIDDETELSEQICDHLELDGFISKSLNEPLKALEIIETYEPDIIVLDKLMPELDGIDVLNSIRKKSKEPNIPVIMLTACNTKFDKLWAFNAGVDDYISKPFDIDELSLRIKALTKRFNTKISLQREIQQNSFQIEIKGQFITLGDKEVPLTSFEFDFLTTLIERKGGTLSSSEIQIKLLNNNVSLEKINEDVTKLKSKLEYVGNKIKEVRGVGYRFI